MFTGKKAFRALLFLILAGFASGGSGQSQSDAPPTQGKFPRSAGAVLWRYPDDIASRNLFYGPGGERDAPSDSFTFLKEDLDGSNPKFDVRDLSGVKWKVKLGDEAQPETVATRLLWAVGYFTDEDYFVRESTIQQMPHRLKRGQSLIHGSTLYSARMERDRQGEKKIGSWPWRQNPFSGTREFNGLRVLMALINNWDLKDVNNTIVEDNDGGSHQIYLVSDLGASFGAPGRWWPRRKSRGNLAVYSHTKFISKITPEYVDFMTPTRPALFYAVGLPQFVGRLHMRWIGRHVPRADARWVGGLLAQLSPQQIRDAFRAAGYSPEDVEAYARVVEERIAELNKL
jgi:hypothetical protein